MELLRLNELLLLLLYEGVLLYELLLVLLYVLLLYEDVVELLLYPDDLDVLLEDLLYEELPVGRR